MPLFTDGRSDICFLSNGLVFYRVIVAILPTSTLAWERKWPELKPTEAD